MGSIDNIAGARKLIAILKWFGVWHCSGKLQKCKTSHPALWRSFLHNSFHLPATFLFFVLMCVAILKAETLEQAGDIMYLLAEAAFIVKLLNFWRLCRRANQFVEESSSDAKFELEAAEHFIWQREQRWFERLAISYVAGGAFFVIYAFATTLLSPYKELPFSLYMPSGWRNSRNYWYAYTYEFCGAMFTCVSNLSIDMWVCYLLFHVALLYRLLGSRLISLKKPKGQDVLSRMRGIVELHQSIKRLTVLCEALVSVPILTQIIMSAFVLCFSAYRLKSVRITESPSEFFNILHFLSVLLLQIFLPCYYAHRITIEADALTLDAYSCGWDELPVSVRQLLYHYMEFLNQPVIIKAGGFFEVGLPIFSKTIHNAYSLLTVIISTDE